MSDDNARSGLESNPSPDGFSAMPSDLSVNGAAREEGPYRAVKSKVLGWCVELPGLDGEIIVANGGHTNASEWAEALNRAFNRGREAAAPCMYAALAEIARSDSDASDAVRELARLALSRARGECDSKGGA